MEESKALVITNILKGVNYMVWSRTTKSALYGKGLWSHIEKGVSPKEAAEIEGYKKPVNEEEQEKWLQEDHKVLHYLQNSLESSILEAYSYCETAKELWDTLQKVYGDTSNLHRVFEVKKALNALSQNGTEFKHHFGKFRSLWAELEMLRPSTIDPKVLNERREQDKVFGLLMTLDPCFNDLIKHILRADKLQSLDEVCSQIQKEEGSVGLFGGKGELAMANKGNYKYDNHYKRGPLRLCEYCKSKGFNPTHAKDKCWRLHPHLRPEHYGSGRESRANKTGEGSGAAMTASSEFVRKADLDALIKALKETVTFIKVLRLSQIQNRLL